ncbi:GNAT family N-acetyltransferase/peptidase C39 family protein [Flavobacterium sp. W21_SRS_FM6]|uniref:GNAT family N-acetyltransferase/peptidase C39 family protein n=1 Tax=Flavobacterium sp. W21_SRS_FM6 TaxID=3240268 RepID=UPI003F91B0D9
MQIALNTEAARLQALNQHLAEVVTPTQTIEVRDAKYSDLAQLMALENRCFAGDRLSKRSFQHWLKAPNCVFQVILIKQVVVAYGLIIMRKGTHLARLYSIAVDSEIRGLGIGKRLLLTLEQQTLEAGKLFIRLEVAKNNETAINLYKGLGYKIFGSYEAYYEDNTDALRMQKNVRQKQSLQQLTSYPWYQQTTEFTCGPSSLMMAMAKIDEKVNLNQALELDIWREATTIYMTSGHGGCHPYGLALAANKRGFEVLVYVNLTGPLFIGGVRSQHKKDIMQAVEHQFRSQVEEANIEVRFTDVSPEDLEFHIRQGASVISLISTYQLDDKKAPHWVCVTEIDEDYLYVHDPDPDDHDVESLDCQHIPIAKQDFYSMSCFGKERLRTAVIIHKR